MSKVVLWRGDSVMSEIRQKRFDVNSRLEKNPRSVKSGN